MAIDKEKRREYQRQYYLAHREKAREYQREYGRRKRARRAKSKRQARVTHINWQDIQGSPAHKIEALLQRCDYVPMGR